jgi:hypothetical protein
MTSDLSPQTSKKEYTMASHVISTTEFKSLKLKGRGKVRDIYDLGDKLLIVATDPSMWSCLIQFRTKGGY